jgi:hypothetical protein
MIIPPDARLRLDPRDDKSHLPEAAHNFIESGYLDVFGRTHRIRLWLCIGNRPNGCHAEISVCL